MTVSFSEYIKSLRAAKRLSLREVAQEAGISNSYLSQVEQGHRGPPHPNTLRKLAVVYEVPVRELLESAGYLEEPELAETAEERIDRAFDFVMGDSRFQAGTRVKGGLTREAKRYIIGVYERVTGAKLLDLK